MAGSVLSAVSDGQWWKKTLRTFKSDDQLSSDANSDMEKQGCHPFYADAIANSFQDKSEVDYSRMKCRHPGIGSLSLNEALFRINRLEDTLSDGGDPLTLPQEVISNLANASMTKDASLSLSYLLLLTKPEDAQLTFDLHPPTAITLQLATYYYALQFYRLLVSEGGSPCPSSIFNQDPNEVTQRILNHIKWCGSDSKTSRWPPGASHLAKLLLHYNEKLIDLTEAKLLKDLDHGIDISRFTADADYKRETILGLAMSEEQNMYELAISLAQRYSLSMWEVYMAHLEFLFDSGLDTTDIQTRVASLDLLGTLTSEPTQFVERMKSAVLPTIAGTDHARLLCFYSLLEGCDLGGMISANDHVRLIKKISSAARDLDYKKLTSENPLDALRPVLNADNINLLAKLAAKIPSGDQPGQYLQPSIVYCGWAIQLFWQKNARPPDKPSDWLHRYEACAEFAHKLLPSDFVSYVDGIAFAPESLSQLSLDVRTQIIQRALKYSKQQASAELRMPKDSSNVSLTLSWEEVVRQMQSNLDHLQTLSSSIIQDLRDSEDPVEQRFAHEFDITRSRPEKVNKLLVQMIIHGQPPETIDRLSSIIKNKEIKGVANAMQQALSDVTERLRNSNGDQDEEGLKELQAIIQTVSKHQQKGGCLVCSDLVMQLLRPFCADVSVCVHLRLCILHLLEKCFDLSADDMVLLLVYRTEAIVKWADIEVTEDLIKTEESRFQLFSKLLSLSTKTSDFSSLAELLKVWPKFRNLDVSAAPWGQLMTTFLHVCRSQESAGLVLRLIKETLSPAQFSSQEILSVETEMVENGFFSSAVKCLLLSEDSELHDKAVQHLLKMDSLPQDETDEELLDLILQRHLTVHVVHAAVYPSLVEHLLSKHDPQAPPPDYLCVNVVANELIGAGLEAEAGSLVARSRGTHRALQTFDLAVSMLSKWLPK